ncbi:MAG: discoidin domain-containing protein, partial [Verrucomicrobiia bacterium]
MWFRIELPEARELVGIRLDSTRSTRDYPRGFKVESSTDGVTWDKPLAEGKGDRPITEIAFRPVKTKHLRITQTGAVSGLYWSIYELQLYAKPGQKPAIKIAKKAKPVGFE